MEAFALEALDKATRLGVGYADVRAQRQRIEEVRTRNGALERAGEERQTGFGVRVLLNGAWGFAAHSGLDRERIGATVRAAVEAARAAGRVNTRPVELAPNPAAVDRYRTPRQRDPFSVSLQEKQALLLETEGAMRAAGAVTTSWASLVSFFTENVLCSSEGARIRQEVTECGAHIWALATGDGKPAQRSFSNYGQAGWEFVERRSAAGRCFRPVVGTLVPT